MNRREFIAASAALVAADHAAGAKGHITKARIAAITDEIGKTQSDAVAFAKQYALQWLELRNVPESGKEFATLSEIELKRYASELAANKLRVSLLKTSLLKSPSDGSQAWWDRQKDNLARAIAAARILGTDNIRIFSGARVADPARAIPEIARAIGDLALTAESARVRLLIENEPSQNVATCAELKAILDLIPSKSVGFNWDPWNALALKEPLWQGYDLLPKARLWNLQIKAEALADTTINWRKLMNTMQKDGFTGIVSLATEIFDGTFDKAGEAMRDVQHFVGELD